MTAAEASSSGGSKSWSVFRFHRSQSAKTDETSTSRLGFCGRFFARGRELEGKRDVHKYENKEKELMGKVQSQDYHPQNSVVFRRWKAKQPASHDWMKWIMFGFVGFSVGFTSFMLKNCIESIGDARREAVSEHLKRGLVLEAFFMSIGLTCACALVSTCVVILIQPAASGSGIPEVIGYLNGSHLQKILNVRTLIIKFISCAFAVGSGMAVGPEGPMIHMGAMIGAGIGGMRSKTLGLKFAIFDGFRDPQSRRDFITCGAGAGVSAAFGAPVGGLLFVMEELASFWSQKLAWMMFFACMCSVATTDLFNSSIKTFHYTETFGYFSVDASILFKVKGVVDMNIMAVFPAIVLGLFGGICGTIFTFLNLKIVRFRLTYIAPIWYLRILEVVVIALVTSTVVFMLPLAFKCRSIQPEWVLGGYLEREALDEQQFNCNDPTTYNPMAALSFNGGDSAIHFLYSRFTYLQCNEAGLCSTGLFGYTELGVYFVVYFLFACWSAASAVSSGLVVPMLLVGGLYGRLLGQLMVDVFMYPGGMINFPQKPLWIDPGIIALIGSASFFGGVSRLTLSLTVIMLEISGELRFLLPIMVSILTAKWVADYITHSLYHALLEVKAVPFLNAEEPVDGAAERMVCDIVRNVMTPDPITVSVRSPVSLLRSLVTKSSHNTFPVTENGLYIGTISADSVALLVQTQQERKGDSDADQQQLDELRKSKLVAKFLGDVESSTVFQKQRSALLNDNGKDDSTIIDLKPYVNTSSISVPETFDMKLSYSLFRGMGLRHLIVVNVHNQPVGIMTRLDFMPFALQERAPKVFEGLGHGHGHGHGHDDHDNQHVHAGGDAEAGIQMEMSPLQKEEAHHDHPAHGHAHGEREGAEFPRPTLIYSPGSVDQINQWHDTVGIVSKAAKTSSVTAVPVPPGLGYPSLAAERSALQARLAQLEQLQDGGDESVTVPGAIRRRSIVGNQVDP